MQMAFVALSGAVLTVLFQPMIGLPIAAYGLAALIFRGRTPVAFLATVVGGVAATALARGTSYAIVFPLLGVPVMSSAPLVFGALSIASLLVVGPVTALMMRGRPASQTVTVLTVALTGLQGAALVAFASGADQGPAEYLMAAVNNTAASVGLPEAYTSAISLVWPGAMVSINLVTAVLAMVAVAKVGARLGVSLNRPARLAVLDMHPVTAVLPIAALALLAGGRLPIQAAPYMENVGNNLLIISRWLFFLQGVAVFAGLYERAKVGRLGRIFGFTLLGVTEMFAPVVSVAGLADIWLNLRRLPREKGASEPPAGDADADETT